MSLVKVFLIYNILLSSQLFAANNWPIKLNKFKKIKTLDASYTQLKKIKSLDISLKSNGRLLLSVPNYFEWRIFSTKNLKYVFKSNEIHFYEDDMKVKKILNSQIDSVLLNPIKTLRAWLRLDKEFIQEMFKIKTLTSNQYQFTPKDEKDLFRSIIIKVGKKSPIDEIVLNEKNGDSMSFVFSNTKISYEK
jgi:outer membrane lipoprotein carrier protein